MKGLGRALATIRNRVLASPVKAGELFEREQTIRCRSDASYIYVLKRAKGIYEDCGRLAPFAMITYRLHLELQQIEIINFGFKKAGN